MGFLSSIAGGLISSAASLYGAHKSQQYAQSNMRLSSQLSYDQWVKQKQNSHQLEVGDLRNAGLNPILSASNGQAMAAPSVGVVSAHMPDLGSDFNSGQQVGVALSNLRNERMQAEAAKKNSETNAKVGDQDVLTSKTQAALNESSTARQRAEADQIIKLTPLQVNKAQQDIANSIAVTNAQVGYYAGMVEAAKEQAAAARDQAAAAIGNMNANSARSQSEVSLNTLRGMNERIKFQSGQREYASSDRSHQFRQNSWFLGGLEALSKSIGIHVGF